MFNVGDEVRVVSNPPHHGWGSVTKDEIGIIRETRSPGRYYIDFPRQQNWKGIASDLALINREPDWEI